MNASNALPIAEAPRRGREGRIALTERQAAAFVWLGAVALNWPLLALLRPGATLDDLLTPGLLLAGATALGLLGLAAEMRWPERHRYGASLFAAGVLSLFAVAAAVVVERALAELAGIAVTTPVPAGTPGWVMLNAAPAGAEPVDATPAARLAMAAIGAAALNLVYLSLVARGRGFMRSGRCPPARGFGILRRETIQRGRSSPCPESARSRRTEATRFSPPSSNASDGSSEPSSIRPA